MIPVILPESQTIYSNYPVTYNYGDFTMKRFIWIFALLMVCFAGSAFAGIMGVLGTLKNAATTGNLWAGLAVIVIAWIFKAIPNAKIYGFIEALFNKLGTVCTLGLSKYKFTAPLWNKYIEPWIVDFIENTVGAAVKGFIAGLRSDDTPE